jgi:hypothetical protein
MTIDKVICKNLETNPIPIVGYDIFMNSILPFINNIYLNKTEKVKNLLQNSIKKAFEKPRKKYTRANIFTCEYEGLRICNLIDDKQIDDINIGLMYQDNIHYIRYDLIDLIQKDDECMRYCFKIDIVVNDKWLSNDDLKNHLNTKEKIGTKKLYYYIDNDGHWNGIKYNFNINERKSKYPPVIDITLTDEIDKTSDEWIRFKKIIIEENFKKKVSDCDDEETRDNLINIHNEEMNFLKKMFLDRLLDVFN